VKVGKAVLVDVMVKKAVQLGVNVAVAGGMGVLV
jgi:hypothetical protein